MENARLPIVDSLTAGTVRRFVTAERQARRRGRSATWTNDQTPDNDHCSPELQMQIKIRIYRVQLTDYPRVLTKRQNARCNR